MVMPLRKSSHTKYEVLRIEELRTQYSPQEEKKSIL